MPLYAYRCKNCGHEFEQRQRMMDDPLTDCPQCAQAELRRVIDRVGVVFKGSGFYVTDNKSNNPAAPSTDKPAENGGTESKASATPAESAPAAKESAPSSETASSSTKSEKTAVAK